MYSRAYDGIYATWDIYFIHHTLYYTHIYTVQGTLPSCMRMTASISWFFSR